MSIASQLSVCCSLVALSAIIPAVVASGGMAAALAAGAVPLAASLVSGIAASKIEKLGSAVVEAYGERSQGKRIDPNHDLPRALRQAQLAALISMLEDWLLLPAEGEFSSLSAYAGLVLPWANRQMKAALRDHSGDAPWLTEALNAAIAEMARTAQADGIVDTRRAAELAMANELDAAGLEMPAGVETLFRSESGWFPRFVAAGSAKIKHQPAVRAIWMAIRTAAIEGHASNAATLAAETLDRLGALEDRIFGAPPILLVMPRIAAPDGVERFLYRAGVTPFVGRSREMDKLLEFVDDEQPVSWQVLTGEGGIGKSRLALELCKHLSGAWSVGFAPREGNAALSASAFAGWRPNRPCLIVIDYAVANVALVRAVLTSLLGIRNQLRQKVRVLLIERSDDVHFQRTTFGGLQFRSEISELRWEPQALHLQRQLPEEIWEISRPFLGSHYIFRRRFLALHRRLDPRQRTLTALILADALSRHGRADFSSLETLMDALLEHERSYWQGSSIRSTVEEPLLALATMIGGYVPSRHAGLVPDGLRDRLGDEEGLAGYQALTHYSPPLMDQHEGVGPLQPDLVGEYFVLSAIIGEPSFNNSRTNQWLIAAAWQHSSEMAEFLTRCRADFPNHPCLPILCPLIAGTVESYIQAAVQAGHAKYSRDPRRRFVESMRFLNTIADDDAVRAKSEMVAWASLSDDLIPEAEFDDYLAQLDVEAAESSELRANWGETVYGRVFAFGETDPKQAYKYLQLLEKAASERPQDREVLTEIWTSAAADFIGMSGKLTPGAVVLLAERLATCAVENDQNETIAENFGRGVANLVASVGGKRPEIALEWFNRIEPYSRAANSPALVEEWTGCAYNLLYHRLLQDRGDCRELLMRIGGALAVAMTPDMIETWGMAIVRYMKDCPSDETDEILGLLESLRHMLPSDEACRAARDRAFSMAAIGYTLKVLSWGNLEPAVKTYGNARAVWRGAAENEDILEGWARVVLSLSSVFERLGDLSDGLEPAGLGDDREYLRRYFHLDDIEARQTNVFAYLSYKARRFFEKRRRRLVFS